MAEITCDQLGHEDEVPGFAIASGAGLGRLDQPVYGLSGEDLEQTILRYVRLYNGQLPQSVLKGRTPIDALKDWKRQRPDIFKKRPYNYAGCDT